MMDLTIKVNDHLIKEIKDYTNLSNEEVKELVKDYLENVALVEIIYSEDIINFLG